MDKVSIIPPQEIEEMLDRIKENSKRVSKSIHKISTKLSTTKIIQNDKHNDNNMMKEYKIMKCKEYAYQSYIDDLNRFFIAFLTKVLSHLGTLGDTTSFLDWVRWDVVPPIHVVMDVIGNKFDKYLNLDDVKMLEEREVLEVMDDEVGVLNLLSS